MGACVTSSVYTRTQCPRRRAHTQTHTHTQRGARRRQTTTRARTQEGRKEGSETGSRLDGVGTFFSVSPIGMRQSSGTCAGGRGTRRQTSRSAARMGSVTVCSASRIHVDIVGCSSLARSCILLSMSGSRSSGLVSVFVPCQHTVPGAPMENDGTRRPTDLHRRRRGPA
jgi:hypothetical protein